MIEIRLYDFALLDGFPGFSNGAILVIFQGSEKI